MESHCWGKGIAGEIVIQYREKEWPGDWVEDLISLVYAPEWKDCLWLYLLNGIMDVSKLRAIFIPVKFW